MKGKRDSLRVWLEKHLNQNTIRGLEWKDPKERIFRICWKHASKHGWSSILDGCVFRAWAIYTGKFKPGEKNIEQPKVWKANFRCALNALPDIQEVVEERETRGNEAQKVFLMKPRVSKQGKRGRSFRYKDASHQAPTYYAKHFQDPNMLQLRKQIVPKSVWTRGIPPPLLRKDKEYLYSTEREGALVCGHPKMKESEPMPEHKIIELIDSWSHELKQNHETTSLFNSMQSQVNSNFSNSFGEASMESYQNPCYQIQSSCVPATSHYYLTQVTSEASSESTGFEYISHI